MSKRILVISRSFWPEDQPVNDLCEKLAERGFRVDVLCGQPCSSSGEFCKGYNSFRVRRESYHKINLYRTVDVKRGNDSHVRIFLNAVVFPVTAALSLKRLYRNTYDAILICQTSAVTECFPGFCLGKKMKVPVFLYALRLWPQSLYSVMDVQSGLFRSFLYRLSMHFYKKADTLIVPSAKTAAYFSEKLGLPDSRLPVVTMPSEAAWETGLRDDSLLEKLAGSFNILIPGDLEGQLSVQVIAGAAELVRKNGLRKIRFVVTGDSSLIRSLKAQIRERGLTDYFFFEGDIQKQNIGKYLYAANVILAAVIPDEIHEYLPPAWLVNALAAGKPLAVTLSGLVKDLIRKAQCGLTCEPGDEGALFSVLKKLCYMPEEQRLEMGRNAQDYRQAFFDREENADLIARILNGESVSEPSDSGIQNLSDLMNS